MSVCVDLNTPTLSSLFLVLLRIFFHISRKTYYEYRVYHTNFFTLRIFFIHNTSFSSRRYILKPLSVLHLILQQFLFV